MPLSKSLLTLFVVCVLSLTAGAQGLLNKTVRVNVKDRPLAEVLTTISKQGHFYFSYLTTVLPQDSLVSISATDKTVRQVLDLLLDGDYIYKESGNYIILLKKTTGQNYYLVTGVVTDKSTGQRLPNASVYERTQLISTLTNSDGYFRLRLKDRYPTAAISVSKDLYADTSLLLSTGRDQDVEVSISPTTYQLKTVDITGHQVEKRWFGKVFLSPRQKLTSLNIGAFFADKPYQFSLTPGLGSHGRMSGQVVNKFSFNLLGGYAAGVDGLEVGSIFNIVKHDMQYVQLAGIFNIVGGKTHGVQLAGIHNNVLDSMKGVQASGLSNIIEGSMRGVQLSGVVGQVYKNMTGAQVQGVIGIVRQDMNGWQVAGIHNYSGGNMGGVQVSGITNYNRHDADGVQVAGAGNINRGVMKGVQVGSLFNYARRVDGVQIGLVNIADTVNGYSIGIVNIVRKGYKKVALYSTDLLPLNVAWKTGGSKLYSILLGGYQPGLHQRWAIGYGIGKRIPFSKVWALTTEATVQNFFQGSWNYKSELYTLQPAINVQLAKGISLFAGPTFMVGENGKDNKISPNYHYIRVDNRWLGWQAGISIF
ncbi:carboxypeptidase-like regulatory domain-containing protein [Chitinophaga sp. Ak27]|uniref:carboxypeptidase-like regulatory domain-containing protein n=1 Tax=Chitinophaga sp. Ak27 TaxID=2726116 RepID=UPI00145EB005|nr:carboxypeptidase-like regulatory domain-containing protein [Chitinophaga sp. Ak27]NLU95186.1 hypothetical protein [Chitinophaga sp. Ak27]